MKKRRQWEAPDLRCGPPKKSDLFRDASIAKAQMQEAARKHANEHHTRHCWARLAWGDGECECLGGPIQ